MNSFLMNMAKPMITQTIEELMSPENIQQYGDRLFDFVENAVEASETTIDDIAVLPIIKQLRKALSIPDND